MLALIIATAILSGEPEALSAKQNAIDSIIALTAVKQRVEAELNATQLLRQQSISGYQFYRFRTGLRDDGIEAALSTGNLAYDSANQYQVDGYTLLFKGNSSYSRGLMFLGGSQWILAGDSFLTAVAEYNASSRKFSAASDANCNADSAYQSVIGALSLLNR